MLEDYVGEDAWRRRRARLYRPPPARQHRQTDDLWRAVETGGRPAGHRHRPRFHAAARRAADPGRERAPARRPDPGRRCARASSAATDQDKPPLAWRVPVIASTGGAASCAPWSRAARRRRPSPGCGPLVVNYGQTGYYRTLYAPPLLARLTANYRAAAADRPDRPARRQLGARPRRLPVGRRRRSTWSTRRRPTPIRGCWSRVADDPRRRSTACTRAIPRTRRWSPATPRPSWRRRCAGSAGRRGPASRANDAVLRAELIETLGAMGDPAVVAEANRRFAANDPSVTAGPLRETILGVVACNADAADLGAAAGAWRATSATRWSRSQLYQLLGSAARCGAGPARARPRADRRARRDQCEPASSRRWPAVHPDLAFDFALAQPRAGRGAGRCLVALALPRRPRRAARPIRR